MDIVKELSKLPTAYVTDALLRLGLGSWTDGVYPVSRSEKTVCGRAVTVKYSSKEELEGKHPSLMVRIRDCGPGEVLVVAANGTPCWLLGENLVRAAQIEGTAGIVVDGCVRDLEPIAAGSMPVFCRGGGTRPFSIHLALDAMDVAVEFAGASVRPGDIVIGDVDGLVIVPADRAEEVLYQAGDIDDYERETRAGIERRAPLEELASIIGRKHALRS